MSGLKKFIQKIFLPTEPAMAANFGKNQKVADTLDAYLHLDKPRFAILLQGKWGSGKTWFIRDYIDKRNNENQPFCYVSLFGIEQLIEIDSQIIASCNPILSKAEGVSRFAGRIIERLNPAIKGDDIEKFAKFLKKWCKIHGNLVLVLDDLERASIQIELVLGYVSNMLDEVGIKVILLCDSEQFSKDEEKFLRFKEKVVGNTIAIEPDIETVFDSQVALQPEEIKKIFEANRTRLIKDFNTSEANNLRNIKRIIYQFLMCYEQMSSEMQNNESYIAEFLHILFAFSMQINKGLPKKDFTNQKVKIFTRYEYPQHYPSIESVSPSSQWLTSISSEFIEKFFYDGIVDKEVLHQDYMRSEYPNMSIAPFVLFKKFSKKDLDENDATNLYTKIKMDIDNHAYTNPRVILHAFDIMLKFSQLGLEEQSEENIVCLAKKYIDDATNLDQPTEASEILSKNTFLTRGSSPFEEIYASMCDRVSQLNINKIFDHIRETCILLPDDPEAFLEKFSSKNTLKGKLTLLDATDFSNRITSVRTQKLHEVLEKVFYHIGNIDNISSHDAVWVRDFYSSLENNIVSLNSLQKHIISEFMEEFQKLIQERYQ